MGALLQLTFSSALLVGTKMSRLSTKNEEMPAPQTSGKYQAGLETTGPIPRFLLVKKLDGDFSKVSPFVISKALYGLVGETKNTKKVKEGLLVETVSNAQSLRLMKAKRFCDSDIEVIPHGSLNISKGIVYCKDLLNCPVEEVLDGLKNQGVINVSRIKTKQEGILVDTANHILTFNSPKLPTEVKAAFYNLKVRPYIPPPMRCYRCQLFGHTAMRCSGEQICVCGKPLHEGRPCETPIICVNCNGPHSARSKLCPKYKIEMAIQEIKITEKLSYFEAKQKVIIPTPKVGISYSQSVQSQPRSIPDIITQMTPQITNIVKSILSTSAPLISFTQADPRQRSESINSSTSKMSALSQTEKRKRGGDKSTTAIESSADETSEAGGAFSDSQRTCEKRGPGRPRKPRKFSDQPVLSSQSCQPEHYSQSNWPLS